MSPNQSPNTPARSRSRCSTIGRKAVASSHAFPLSTQTTEQSPHSRRVNSLHDDDAVLASSCLRDDFSSHPQYARGHSNASLSISTRSSLPPLEHLPLMLSTNGVSPDNTTVNNTRNNGDPQATRGHTERAVDSMLPKTQAPMMSHNSGTWMPTTLMLWYISTIVSVSFLLGAVTLFLTWYSNHNSGLGDDSEAPLLIFGWRFSPTLIATIYSILVGAMVLDIKRTEVYARLGKAKGAPVPATSTILQGSRSWWNDPFDAFSNKKNNGYRSWTLFWASVPNILSFLVLSPLSAGLLYPDNISISSQQTFSTLAAFDYGTLKPYADDVTFFRTISSVLLNTTTSPWISNEYSILPFWPAEESRFPSSATFSDYTPQTWSGNTWVFRADLECKPLPFKGLTNSTTNDTAHLLYTYHNNTRFSALTNITTMSFESEDGCLLQIDQSGCGTNAGGDTGCHAILTLGGGWWSGPPTYDSYYASGKDRGESGGAVKGSPQCGNRTIFFLNSPYIRNASFQALGEICDTTYSMANIATTVTIAADTTVVFNIDDFNTQKKLMDTTVLNHTAFDNAFLSQDWTTKIRPPFSADSAQSLTGPGGQQSVFGGPLLIIAAKHDFDTRWMMGNMTSLLGDGQELKQRFLGETLFRNFQELEVQPFSTVQGQRIIQKHRIVVSTGIGIAVGVLFILSGFMILTSGYCSRLSRRPMDLKQDPSPTMSILSMISRSQGIKQYFRGSDRLSDSDLRNVFTHTSVSMRGDTLDIYGMKTSMPESKIVARDAGILRMSAQPTSRTKEPPTTELGLKVLGIWAGIALLSTLTLLAVLIGILFWKSQSPGLYQKALTYQLNLNVENTSFSAIAPYSILTTLVAVAIKLWWGAVQDPFKRLQSYISIVKRPTPSSRGLSLSYIASPLLWVSGRAISNKHWLLALVCFGAFLSEIFTITMSALWSRQPGVISQSIAVSRSLEMRTAPSIFQGYLNSSPGGSGSGPETWQAKMLGQVFGSALTSWLYGATIELVYNTTSPPWSKDDWSFSPLDLTSIPTKIHGQDISNTTTFNFNRQYSALGPTVNLTVQTISTRARLDCEVQDLSNHTAWLLEADFNDGSWNATPPGLPNNIGYELGEYTQFNADPMFQLLCCANETDDTLGEAAVGYWSAGSNGTFDITWLLGKPFEDLYFVTTNGKLPYMPHYIWSEIPTATGLTCTAIIEAANASVTVDAYTGMVQDYEILDTPQNMTSAWDDNYLGHNVTVGSPAMWDPYNTVFAFPGNLSSDGINYVNFTLSHGYIFQQALLGASYLSMVGSWEAQAANYEPLDDHTYNFRVKGLNSDFMSYVALALAGNDKHALLNATTLATLSSKVLGTFYKHFASENITQDSWAYQKLGATVPSDLGVGIELVRGQWAQNLSHTPTISQYQTRHLMSGLSSTVEGVIYARVEVLEMSEVAVILSLAILAFLIVVAVVVFGWERDYFKMLPRDVDNLASVIGFLYASGRLQRWINEGEGEGREEVMTRLGRFEGDDGEQRWGVERVDGDRGGGEMVARGGDEGMRKRMYVRVRNMEGDGDD